MANGKAKGSGYERTICKFLSKWLNGKEKPYVWWRSPSSGGLATITAQNPNLTGDIIAVLPEGNFFTDVFSIEIKSGYPKSSFHKFFKKLKNNEILQFWEQSKHDASKSNKEPMVIWKKDRKEPLVFVTENVVLKLWSLEKINSFRMNVNGEKIYVFNMVDFFTNVTPNDIIDTDWSKNA